MNTENIAHYFYGSAPAEDELMNAVFSGENTVDALKTAANQHEFLYTEKIRLWNELHMALVGCPGTEPISHEPLSQAIVGVDFVDDGQVAYTLLEDLDDIVSALNEVDEDAFLDKYLQQNGVENRDAALAEFRTLRDFYNKCQDFHGDDDYILVVGIYAYSVGNTQSHISLVRQAPLLREGRSRTNVHRLYYMHFVRSLANMGGGEWHEKRKLHCAEM